MTFLPNTANLPQDLFSLLVAVPLTLIGTGFLLFLADVGTRIA